MSKLAVVIGFVAAVVTIAMLARFAPGPVHTPVNVAGP